jgi:Ca-activated chloride channel family protein
VSFAAPYMLLALLAVPLAAFGYRALESRRSRRAEPWSNPALLSNIVSNPPGPLRYVPAALFLLGLGFLLVGFARPQRSESSVQRGAATIVLAFDVSGSMAANDVAPTRILAARNAAVQLLKELPSRYEVAVVTFSDTVDVVVPPTFDRKKVIAGLPTVAVKGGTALGDAIDESVAAVVQAVGTSEAGNPHPPGAVLLISDGAQTDPGTQPQDAAEHAILTGIPIDTISVGTLNGIVTQTIALNGGQTATQKIRVPVDPAVLQVIAQQTGGTFFKAASAAQLTRVYKNLGSHISSTRGQHPLNAATAEIALVLILGGVLLSGLWFSRLA